MNDLSKNRAEEILNVIISYAKLNFNPKAAIYEDDSVEDAIAAGVNMLGEELERTTLSVKEKDNLLREIHHRVKNNMQIMSSMLRLQARATGNSEFEELINESLTRLEAMAVLHELLYRSGDFQVTTLDKYVDQLLLALKRSYFKPDSEVELNHRVSDDIVMSMDQLIPLGLIINEFVSNSLKYAFPNGAGHIVVEGEMTGNEVVVTVSDNGTGELHLSNDSLGIQLIELLAEQLDAKLKITGGQGSQFHLTIPV